MQPSTAPRNAAATRSACNQEAPVSLARGYPEAGEDLVERRLGAIISGMKTAILLSALAFAPLGCSIPAADAHSTANNTREQADVHAIPDAPVETRLSVPAGLEATIVAKLPGARVLTVGPDGALYVSQSVANQITRLVINSNGVADSPAVVIKGLNKPHGTAFHNGWFYIANTDGVVRVKLNAAGQATGTPEQLNHYSAGQMHWTRSIVFGPDNRMYVSIGSSCNVCVESDFTRAAVMQYDENGQHGRMFGRGLRNAVGMAFNPVTHELWVSQNERDNIAPDHEDLPPDEINIVHAGADYGWPYCYGDRVPNPEFHDPARCASTIPPVFALPAHSAPLGMTFLNGASELSAADRGSALVALHGSWNRKVPTISRVVLLKIRNNRPVGIEDFVTGWQGPDGKRWGRPADVAVLHDGSIVIADDGSGEIIRLAKKP